MDNSPVARRRTILKLLAGSIAGGGLNGLRSHLALAAAPLHVRDELICLEFDEKLYSRLSARGEDRFEPLTEFDPSETIRLADGSRIDAFRFRNNYTEAVEDIHGRGRRAIVHGVASDGIEKWIAVLLYDQFPGFALLKVAYRNMGIEPISIEGWVNGAHVLKPAPDGVLEYWSFSGASYADRRDWVQPLHEGFDQRNFMGMNASDYGGGTPVLDVWRRDAGLAVGHVETVPKLIGLPLTVTKAGARVAVESDQMITLQPGESFSTFETFVAVHRGDYFATLDAYRRILAKRGMEQAKVPAAAYEPIWCGWGYEHDFTVNQVLGALPKASELGLIWAVPDDGWQTALGDWYLARLIHELGVKRLASVA